MLLGIALFVGTVVGMEAFAHVSHKHVMHGWLWILHRSHHEPRRRGLEPNDLFAVLFALPGIAAIRLGLHGYPLLLPIGAGIATYGMLYIAFHELLVHRRIRHSYVPKRGYLRRIVQAHHVHHATRTQHGGESFGFFYAPDYRKRRPRRARAQAEPRRAAG